MIYKVQFLNNIKLVYEILFVASINILKIVKNKKNLYSQKKKKKTAKTMAYMLQSCTCYMLHVTSYMLQLFFNKIVFIIYGNLFLYSETSNFVYIYIAY